ncbi:unnamed protein product [Cuscuta europaea]|uniref:GTD-binding domain-containing protein n=1 Tax=Cuscuta europaea TaxID=41803 RepID=A0A9P1EDW3_CUSEU|nr:unnamed protein product [Cuscuta europaea]
MGCEVDCMWSLSSLVGAFLDLAIAYFLLCASSVVFLGTKFLGLFGLHLPCPCNGLFGTAPNRDLCLKRLLVDFPNEKVSNVHYSVEGKFPFNDHSCRVNMRLIRENDNNKFKTSHGLIRMEGQEASCSSVTDARKSISVPRIEFKPKTETESVREGRADVKGKGASLYKNRSGTHHLRKRALAIENWMSSSVSSYDPPETDFESCPISPPSINKERKDIRLLREDCNELYGNGIDARCSQHNGQRDGFDWNGFPDGDVQQTDKNVSSYEELKANDESLKEATQLRVEEDDEEEEEEEEEEGEEGDGGRDALYLELEKERNAAAIAADEAMAMISRLQEEKASIEMEARQYQRIYEEKSVYDAEEMDILKEILVRREREKHFLEKEVEAYRNMMISVRNDEPDGAGGDERQPFDYSLYESEDPILMLHQLSASIDKKTMTKCKGLNESSNLEHKKGSSTPKQGRLASYSSSNQVFQEKEMVTMVNDSYVSERKKEENSHDPSLGFCPSNSSLDKVLHVVHDVHVIDDEGESFSANGNQNSASSQMIDVNRDAPSTSSSDLNNQGLPPLGPKTMSLQARDALRRHSMSTFDIERLKLDFEVERLRERLKSVQEGREKLNVSVENREGDKLQLKLLEDIARQLNEIRHLTQPGRGMRQASLPPPSSKGTSKKKRSRSVSSGVQNSS